MGLRPAIRPGAALLRRDHAHLQIGTAPGFVIRDQPGLLPLLRMLNGQRSIDALTAVAHADIPEFAGDPQAIVDELMGAGAVFDARQWDFPRSRFLSEEARCRCASGLPVDLLGRRADYRVALIGDRACGPLLTIVASILEQSGVLTAPSSDADLMVVFSMGEPGRGVFDNATANAVDHLMVVIDEERVRIGPLVSPGSTPCIHCYDCHRSDWDRAWPALVSQFGRPRHTIVTPAAVSPTTQHVAAAEIAADVVAHCDYGASRTAAQIIAIGPGHQMRARWQVSFHPACGCALLNVA